MKICIIGGGVNGLSTALKISELGHDVTIFEKDKIMSKTSASSTKLIHGGLRYLENAKFKLVRESLIARNFWINYAPEIVKPIKILIPIYKNNKRGKIKIKIGLFFYDLFTDKNYFPKSKWVNVDHIKKTIPELENKNLIGGFEFYDAQMDDLKLGLKIAKDAVFNGVKIIENKKIIKITTEGLIETEHGENFLFDRILNISGPWAKKILDNSNIKTDYDLDLIRGSHIILEEKCTSSLMLENSEDQRIFFVLPWENGTLLGTTEVRQSIQDQIDCTEEEISYLLKAYLTYFPNSIPKIRDTFSGLRPLINTTSNPNQTTRESLILKNKKLITVFGGKWTTSMSLAEKIIKKL